MTTLDWSHCSAVECSPGKVSGAWVFRGTRVSVKSLFENLEDGATVDDFLKWFPGVGREQVLTVMLSWPCLEQSAKGPDSACPTGRLVPEADLKLDELRVVYPGEKRYALAKKVEVVPLSQLVNAQ